MTAALLFAALASAPDIDRAESDYLAALAGAREAYFEAAGLFASSPAVSREVRAMSGDPAYRPTAPPRAAADYAAALDRAAADLRRDVREAARFHRRLGRDSRADALLRRSAAFLKAAPRLMEHADLDPGRVDVRPLEEGERALGNRAWKWADVPAALDGHRTLCVRGSSKPQTLRVVRGGRLRLAAGPRSAARLAADGWKPTGHSLTLTDPGRTRLAVYESTVAAGELELPADDWAGPVPLLPPR